jgi:hypothetical protein
MALQAELTVTKAERPFPEAKVKLGARGTEVTVQLPEVHTTRINGRFDIVPGGSAVLTGLGGVGDAPELMVIIEVLRVPMVLEGPR